MKKAMVMVLTVTIALSLTGCITGRIYGVPLDPATDTTVTRCYSDIAKIVEFMKTGDLESINARGYHAGEADAETFEDFWAQWESLRKTYGQPTEMTLPETYDFGKYYIAVADLAMENGGSLMLQAEYDMDYQLLQLYLYETGEAFLAHTQMPEGIEEIDVVIGEGTDHELPGKITKPVNVSEADALKAAVLVGGDGSNTMDMKAGNTYLYRDLAWKLAEEGIVSIRFDKRTLVYQEEALDEAADVSVFTVAWEYTEDAIRAAEVLKTLPYVDESQIWYIGHSQGAQVASRVDTEAGGLFAGFVLINSSPRGWWEVAYDQYINYGLIDRSSEEIYYLVSKVKTERDFIADGSCEKMNEQELAQTFILTRAAGFWVDYRSFDYVAAFKELAKPTFILQGGTDYQITEDVDFAAWQEELAGCDWAEMKSYEGLNHLLVESKGAFAGHYKEYDIPGLADDGALSDIAAFILQH